MHSPLKTLTHNFIVWKMGVQNMATMHSHHFPFITSKGGSALSSRPV